MERRPLYGGRRGIQSREKDVTDKLMTVAQSDFAHDFGENVPERDKYMKEDLQRFVEIAQGYGIGKVKALTTGFTSVLGSTPYKLLASSIINNRIFPVQGNETLFLNEERALKDLGIDYLAIKAAFKAEMKKNAATLNTATLTIPNLVFNAPGGETRTYEVTGVLMKDKGGEGVLNIASRFQTVSRGKTNFALIVDASGGLSMTSIVNSDIGPEPVSKSTFYIIENIENDSDSATKLKHFDKPKIPGREAKQPDLFFLRDQVDTVLYPNFKLDVAKADGELLFGSADLVLSRAGDDMEADFTFPGDDGTYHIENISQNANVKNASLNIVASALAEGATINQTTNALDIPSGIKKPYLFPYIKRVGDWCQALSLLDGSRKYSILDSEHNPTGGEGTLDDLRKNEIDTAVGLLTLDRILLGYALSLGVDVFFTTAPDLRLLLYFHNTETTLTDKDYLDRIVDLKRDYETASASIGKDKVSDIIGEGTAYIKASTNEVDYIQRLRSVFYRLSILRTDFTTLGEKLASINTELGTTQDPKTAFGLYSEGITILSKLKADEAHNTTQRTSFATYPSLVEEKRTFTMIQTRPGSRGAVTTLMKILSKDLYNDAIQCQKLFVKYGKPIENLLNYPSADPVFINIFTALKEIRILFGAAQTGGGPGDIESLKQFIVTPLESNVYYAVANGTPPPDVVINEDTPLPLILHSYYRDKESYPYTVVDNYIITREDLPVFRRIYSSGIEGVTPEDQKFLARRIMILFLDILQGELEKVTASEDDYGTAGQAIIPSDVKDVAHRRIYFKVASLQKTYNTFLSTSQFDRAFVDAINDYFGADLLSNEGINEIAIGKDGITNPNDFKRTFEKIQTVRSVLLHHTERARKAQSSNANKVGPKQAVPAKRTVRNPPKRDGIYRQLNDTSSTDMELGGSRVNVHTRRRSRRARKSV